VGLLALLEEGLGDHLAVSEGRYEQFTITVLLAELSHLEYLGLSSKKYDLT